MIAEDAAGNRMVGVMPDSVLAAQSYDCIDIDAARSTPGFGTSRPVVEGKFLRVDGARFTVQGVTYGTFARNEEGFRYPDRHIVERDFEAMREAGINTVRLYIE